MSSKRKSDVSVDKSKKKVKKDESDGDEFDDENDSMSDASNNGADDPDDKSSEPVQEFLPGSEASEKLVSKALIKKPLKVYVLIQKKSGLKRVNINLTFLE